MMCAIVTKHRFHEGLQTKRGRVKVTSGMGRRYFVATRQLQKGMKVDQSIVDGTERVLVARGSILDDYVIQGLRKLGVSGVYIREGEDDSEVQVKDTDETVARAAMATIEKLKVHDRSKVQITESVRARVAEGISYLCSNTESEQFADITKNITHDLMEAINANDAIAVDISLLKVSDEYTFKHSVDVATMAMIIAKKLGMKKEEIYDIGIAGLLHDIGKSRIPNEILNKPNRLTDDEFEIIKQHATYGYQIIKEKEGIKDSIKLAVLQHHEKSNGTGYPMGVAATQICPFAKIISVVDIYDALVTERPYKQGFSQRDAVEMIMTMTAELDMTSLRGFMRSIILYPVGSSVKLSNGEVATVVENYETSILRPKVVGTKTGRVYDLANDIGCANIIIY